MSPEPALLQSSFSAPGAFAVRHGVDSRRVDDDDDDASLSHNADEECDYVCPLCSGSGRVPSLAVTEATVVDESLTSNDIPVVMGKRIVKRRMLRRVGKSVRKLPKLIKSISSIASLPRRRGHPKDDNSTASASLATPQSDDTISTLTLSQALVPVTTSFTLPDQTPTTSVSGDNTNQIESQEQCLEVRQEEMDFSIEKAEIAFGDNANESACPSDWGRYAIKTQSDDTIESNTRLKEDTLSLSTASWIIPDNTNFEWFEPPAPQFCFNATVLPLAQDSSEVGPCEEISVEAPAQPQEDRHVDTTSSIGISSRQLTVADDEESPVEDRPRRYREEPETDESAQELFPPPRRPIQPSFLCAVDDEASIATALPSEETRYQSQTSLSMQLENDSGEAVSGSPSTHEGPFVNDKGQLIESLSRVDPMDLQESHDVSTGLNDTVFSQDATILDHASSRIPAKESSIPPVPLSMASVTDDVVFNDTLKVVMLGGNTEEKSWLAHTIQGTDACSQNHSTLGVDVLSWDPPTMKSSDVPVLPVKFKIWDVYGCDTYNSADSQSLFFSSSSLYVLPWDLAINDRKTYLIDDDNDIASKLQANLALREGIYKYVVPWVDCVVRCGPSSMILPVAVIPEGMGKTEVKRRCDMMIKVLAEYTCMGRHIAADKATPILLTDGGSAYRVSQHGDCTGVNKLRKTMVAAADGRLGSVFNHLGSAVPIGTMAVLEAIRRFRHDQQKIIEVSKLNKELALSKENVRLALCFLSSIGEITYFGTPADTRDDGDALLSNFIVLCNCWLAEAVCCVRKQNLKGEVTLARLLVNTFGIESGEGPTTTKIADDLIGKGQSNCPLLTSGDARLLWSCNTSIREAAKQCCCQSETSDASMTLYCFLDRVLIHAGIFLPVPLAPSSPPSPKSSDCFFVSDCLSEPEDRTHLWTYKSKGSWRTTLCHSLPLQHGAPPNIIDQISVNLLRDLSEFSGRFQDITPATSHTSGNASAFSFSSDDSVDEQSLEPVGPVKIHQIMCWKSCVMLKIGMIFEDHPCRDSRESIVEIFVSIVGESSEHCVASSSLAASTHQLIISSKGEVGHNAQKIWKGGYRVVLDSVLATMATNTRANATTECLVACPDCLARSDPRDVASYFVYTEVAEMAKTTHPDVLCERGHHVDTRLLCGTCNTTEVCNRVEFPPLQAAKRLPDIAPSVVMIGVWNQNLKKLCCVGSGFIVDADKGLVVTAAHVLFVMEEGDREFGYQYEGKIVIGVVPRGQTHCHFRYVADVVASDVSNVDACVVRIKSRLSNDVGAVGPSCADQLGRNLANQMGICRTPKKEKLLALKLTRRYELEQTIRIIGFNQGGEGLFKSSYLERVDMFIDSATGHICKRYRAAGWFDNGFTSTTESTSSFEPREEIVVERCHTICGQSGGPCVNDSGDVIGILSRVDTADPQRCYLVPSTELIALVEQAKKTVPGT